jgi:hypothetical protein
MSLCLLQYRRLMIQAGRRLCRIGDGILSLLHSFSRRCSFLLRLSRLSRYCKALLAAISSVSFIAMGE